MDPRVLPRDLLDPAVGPHPLQVAAQGRVVELELGADLGLTDEPAVLGHDDVARKLLNAAADLGLQRTMTPLCDVLSQMELRAGRHDDAIADYTAALKIASVNVQPMILTNRANAFLQKGNHVGALDDVTKALGVNSKYFRAYQTRAAVYTRLGQADKAQADMQTAQQLQPK